MPTGDNRGQRRSATTHELEFAGDVGDAVGPLDVDGEAAQAGEVSGFDAGSAGVFAERDVADAVAADRLGERLGAETWQA